MPSPKLTREEVERVFNAKRSFSSSGSYSATNSPTTNQRIENGVKVISSPSLVTSSTIPRAWDLVLDLRLQDVFSLSTRLRAIDSQIILKEIPSSNSTDTRLLLLCISNAIAQVEYAKLLRPGSQLTSCLKTTIASQIVYLASKSTPSHRSIPVQVSQIRTPNDPEIEILRRTWANVPSFTSSTKIYEWLQELLVTKQPIDAVRGYFGDSVAFYFSFLESYTQSLSIPAILGLIFYLFRGKKQGEDTYFAIFFASLIVLWAASFIKLWRRKESELALVWSAPTEEEGNEEDADIAASQLERGGTGQWSDEEGLFKNKSTSSSSTTTTTAAESSSSSISTSTSSSSSSSQEELRSVFLNNLVKQIFISLPVMLLCVSFIILYISGEESLRRLLTRDLHDWKVSVTSYGISKADRTLLPKNSLYVYFPSWFITYILPEIPLLLFVIGVPLIDLINTSIVKRLVKFENHTSRASKEASYVSKLALLRILNAHTAPLYVAFIEQDLPALRYRLMFKSVFELIAGNIIALVTTFITEQLAIQKVGRGKSENKRDKEEREGRVKPTSPTINTISSSTSLFKEENNSLQEGKEESGLRKRFSLTPSLSTSSTVSDIRSNNQELIEEKYSYIDDDTTLISSIHVQLSLGEFSTDDEMLELLNQFSSIVLFAAVFPLAAPLAMLHNALEQRSDALKLLHQRRPFPNRVYGIGESWKRAFEIVAVLGAITNAGLAGLSYLQTQSNNDKGVHHSYLGLRFSSLIFIVIFEHILLLLLTITFGLIPNKSEATRLALIKQQKEFKRILSIQHITNHNSSSSSSSSSRLNKTTSSLSLFNSIVSTPMQSISLSNSNDLQSSPTPS